LGVDPFTIAARIDSIPTELLEVDRIEPVKAHRRRFPFDCQPLVTETSRYAIGPQQRSQQVALRVAESCAVTQDVGRSASDGIALVIRTMLDFISNESEALLSRGKVVAVR
jgi:hypothetical protein